MKKAKRISVRENGLGSVRIFLVRMFSLIAIGIAGYLAIASWSGGGVAGCGNDGMISCDHVISSKWSRWLEIPVGVLAMVAYLLIFILTWFVSKRSQRIVHSASWSMVIVMAVSCLGAAVWFIGLQAIAIQNICIYCMLVHACGVIIAVLLLSGIPIAHEVQDHRWLATMQQTAGRSRRQQVKDQPALNVGMKLEYLATTVTAGLFAVMLLIVGQMLFPHQTMLVEDDITANDSVRDDAEIGTKVDDVNVALTEKHHRKKVPAEVNRTADPTENGLELSKLPPEEDLTVKSIMPERILSMGNEEKIIQVDVYAEARLGNPESDFVIVKLFDYTCPACRAMHGFLEHCKARYGEQIVIVMLPSPYHSKCNHHVEKDTTLHNNACEYARLALAVWQLDPAFFPVLHNWLMMDKKPPSLPQAMEYVKQRIDAKILQQELSKPSINQMLQRNISRWEKTGQHLPTLVFTTAVVTGLPNDKEHLFKFMDPRIGFVPRR